MMKQKKLPKNRKLNWKLYYALSTAPERKQEVQTYNLLGVPLTLHLTDLTLDFHILFERLCEWLTLFPK